MRIFKKHEKVTTYSRIWKYKFLGLTYLVKEKKIDSRKTKLFGITISSHQKNSIITNSLNFKQLFSSNVVQNKSITQIDIVIPIYNGYEYLPELFNSIRSYTDLGYHLFVIDDCSPDKKIASFLEEQKTIFSDKLTVIRNEINLGFLKSVNKAVKETSNHVVIINTDVVLPPNWASRLLQPIFMNDLVASVTPFSNAATIFSLPIMNIDNVFDGDIKQANTRICRLNPPFEKLHFSTGVGFCMALNRKAINKIGLFDEIYEKGYGEENDWCQRAIQAGFFNTIAGNLFVWHKHGGSFASEEKKELIQSHLEILASRFPQYGQDTQKIIHNNDYLSLRFTANCFLFNAISSKTEVWLDYTESGKNKIIPNRRLKASKDNTFRIQGHFFAGMFCLSYNYKNYADSIILDYEDAFLLWEQLDISKIVLNNLRNINKSALGERLKNLQETQQGLIIETTDAKTTLDKIIDFILNVMEKINGNV